MRRDRPAQESPPHKGHSFGENSKEYNDALISNDKWTGRIIQKLKDLKLNDKTLVYVTADHGFNEGMTGHGNAPRVFLATNDTKVMRNGDRADVAPTILDRFGLDLGNLSRKAITATRPGLKDPPPAGYPLIRPLTAEETRDRESRRHAPVSNGPHASVGDCGQAAFHFGD